MYLPVPPSWPEVHIGQTLDNVWELILVDGNEARKSQVYIWNKNPLRAAPFLIIIPKEIQSK